MGILWAIFIGVYKSWVMITFDLLGSDYYLYPYPSMGPEISQSNWYMDSYG
jgi:hypothetical protein